MKKVKIALLVCATAALSLNGWAVTVSIPWTAGAGFYFNSDPSTGILGAETGNSALAQLIYSLDANVDSALAGGGVSGDDVLWDSFTVTEGVNSSEWADFSAPIFTTSYTAGYVYARIFQNNVVSAGDWYYYSSPFLLEDKTEIQVVQLNTDLANGNAIDSGLTVAQVVPEPATALLLGIGGGIAWLIRLKQRLS